MNDYVNRVTIAQMLGVDERMVYRYQNQDQDPLPFTKSGQKNQYKLIEVVAWLQRKHARKIKEKTGYSPYEIGTLCGDNICNNDAPFEFCDL